MQNAPKEITSRSQDANPRRVRLNFRFLAVCSAFGAAMMAALPANAQVMARGYWHHVESRASFFISDVTEADQVTVEEIMYEVDGYEDMSIPAWRHSFTDTRGTQYRLTAVDFAPHFPAHNSTVQAAMANATADYRPMGTVTLDQGARSDRIPAHTLNIELPNGNKLSMLFMLHQNDDMNERRLIIAEAETPPGARQPTSFLSSIGIINPEYFGTDADPTLWRVRYTPAGPPIRGAELVATQVWGFGEFGEVMSVGGEAIPE